jgi:hypothetical protein
MIEREVLLLSHEIASHILADRSYSLSIVIELPIAGGITSVPKI